MVSMFALKRYHPEKLICSYDLVGTTLINRSFLLKRLLNPINCYLIQVGNALISKIASTLEIVPNSPNLRVDELRFACQKIIDK